MPLPEFRAGQPAARVDKALRQALTAYERAQECAVLWFAEVARRSLFRELGYPSLEQYATVALGFSRNRYWQFKRLADDLDRLPVLREAVAGGRVGWTKAQQVARVATERTEATWVEKAAVVGRRELADEVKRVREAARERRKTATAGDPPTTLTFRLDGPQLARYEALIEKIRKRGVVPREHGRAEILLAALEELANADDLRRRKSTGPPVRIVVKRCPKCEKAAVVTRQGEKRLSRAETEAAACDARIHETGMPNWATVKPSVRAEVLARDGHRCRAPGCGATRFLEIHHVKSRESGGSNGPDNLITLCSRCHRFEHQRTKTSFLTRSSPPAVTLAK